MQNLRQDYSKNYWSNVHNFGSASWYEVNLETEPIFLGRGQIRASRAQPEIKIKKVHPLQLISGWARLARIWPRPKKIGSVSKLASYQEALPKLWTLDQ